MELKRIAPWFLITILSWVCWQQHQTIQTLRQESSSSNQEITKKSPGSTLQNQIIEKKIETKKIRIPAEKAKQVQPVMVQSQRQQALSNEELEDMIEHRALERLEEIEEDKRQKRVDQLTDHMQRQVDGWGQEFNWSSETQNTMMDIMTDYVHGRVEVHVLLKNGTLNRDGIRPYFQQIAKERNDAIVELVGADEFAKMEDNLHPRGAKEESK